MSQTSGPRAAGLGLKIEVFSDAGAVADAAAAFIAAEARGAVEARGRFVLAVSGGHTPWMMLRALAERHAPWTDIHVFQVDERVAPAGDADRNLTHLRESLRGRALAHIYPMPVEDADLDAAALRYADQLREVAGSPPVLDLVHLGLGPDGHTASLTPGDPVLGVTDADVAATAVYQGHRRMTLTYPTINRARRILWLVTGEDKADVLVRLADGDPTIPGARVRQDNARVFADRAAARSLGASSSAAG